MVWVICHIWGQDRCIQGFDGVGHVSFMGTGQVHTGVWWGNLRERDHLEDL
jgi:hypothetical protein